MGSESDVTCEATGVRTGACQWLETPGRPASGYARGSDDALSPHLHPLPTRAMPPSIDSLDSVSVASDTSFGTDDEELLEQEWKESIGQLQQLFGVVLLPIFGRWLGRKWSFWGQYHYRECITLGSCPHSGHSVCQVPESGTRQVLLFRPAQLRQYVITRPPVRCISEVTGRPSFHPLVSL